MLNSKQGKQIFKRIQYIGINYFIPSAQYTQVVLLVHLSPREASGLGDRIKFSPRAVAVESQASVLSSLGWVSYVFRFHRLDELPPSGEEKTMCASAQQKDMRPLFSFCLPLI